MAATPEAVEPSALTQSTRNGSAALPLIPSPPCPSARSHYGTRPDESEARDGRGFQPCDPWRPGSGTRRLTTPLDRLGPEEILTPGLPGRASPLTAPPLTLRPRAGTNDPPHRGGRTGNHQVPATY